MSATIDAPTPPRPTNAAAAGAVAGDVFARLAASWSAEAGGEASPALAREVAAVGGRPLVEAYVVEGDILNTEVLALGRALLGGTAPVAVGAAYRIDNPEAPFGFGALFDLDPKIEAHVDYVPLLQEQIFSRAAQALGRVPTLS